MIIEPDNDLERFKKLKTCLGLTHDEQEQYDFDEQVERFFLKRAKEMRLTLIFILASNILHQTVRLFNIDTKELIIIQSIYWVCTIISVFLIALSYKTGKLNNIKYVHIITYFRNALRLFNFENIESSIGFDLVQCIVCLIML